MNANPMSQAPRMAQCRQEGLSWFINPPWPLLLAMGLLAGLINLLLPTGGVFVALVAIVLLWGIAKHPEFGVLAIVAYTSTILNEETVPIINLGSVSLLPADVLLGILLLLLTWRLIRVGQPHPRATPLDLAILLLVAVSILSTIWAVWSGGTDFHSGIRKLRPMIYYLLYFPVVYLITHEAARKRLWAGLLFLALLTSVAAMIQAVTGPAVPIIPGRVESLYTAGQNFDGIARVIPPGEPLIFLFLVLVGLALAEGRGTADALGKLAITGLLAGALVLTYRRMLWGAVAMALILAWLVMNREYRRRMMQRALLGLALVGLVLVSLWILAPKSSLTKVIDASASRALSLIDQRTYQRGDRDQATLEQRAVELEYALPRLFPPSLLGIGLGSTYRPCLPMDKSECQGTYYIHNGPVALLLNLGILGAGTLLWIWGQAILRGLRHWQGVERQKGRIILLGCTLALGVLLPASLLEPYFQLWNWVTIVAIMLGTIMSIPGWNQDQGPSSPRGEA